MVPNANVIALNLNVMAPSSNVMATNSNVIVPIAEVDAAYQTEKITDEPLQYKNKTIQL